MKYRAVEEARDEWSDAVEILFTRNSGQFQSRFQPDQMDRLREALQAFIVPPADMKGLHRAMLNGLAVALTRKIELASSAGTTWLMEARRHVYEVAKIRDLARKARAQPQQEAKPGPISVPPPRDILDTLRQIPPNAQSSDDAADESEEFDESDLAPPVEIDGD